MHWCSAARAAEPVLPECLQTLRPFGMRACRAPTRVSASSGTGMAASCFDARSEAGPRRDVAPLSLRPARFGSARTGSTVLRRSGVRRPETSDLAKAEPASHGWLACGKDRGGFCASAWDCWRRGPGLCTACVRFWTRADPLTNKICDLAEAKTAILYPLPPRGEERVPRFPRFGLCSLRVTKQFQYLSASQVLGIAGEGRRQLSGTLSLRRHPRPPSRGSIP